jgi:hypothetical protein
MTTGSVLFGGLRPYWSFLAEVWKPLSVLVLLTLGTAGLIAHQTHAPDFHARWSNATLVPQSLSPEDTKTLIAERAKRYAADGASLSLTFKLIISFVIAAFMVTTSQSDTLKIPWVDIAVPTGWFYVIVPIALIYLWLAFGFTLNEVINSRAILLAAAKACTRCSAALYPAVPAG